MDEIANVNTDNFCLKYRKRFKVGYSDNFGTGGVADAQYFSNNDYKIHQKVHIDLMPYIVHNLKYNDNSGTPSNRALTLAVEAINPNGSQYGTDQVPAWYSMSINYEYTDV